MAIRNVALIGASGNLGRYVLKALSEYNVTIISRNSSAAVFGSGNVIKVSDSYPVDELTRALTGQDAVVVTATFRSNDAQKNIIDAAVNSNVKKFIPSHFGSSALKDGEANTDARNVEKDKVVDYLKERGIGWTAIVTGLWFDLALGNGFLGYKDNKATIWDDGSKTWSASTRPRIANAIVEVLKKDIKGYVYISSFEISQNQILESLERVTGRKWEVTHVKSEDKVRDALIQLETATGIPALIANGNLSLAKLFTGAGGRNQVKAGLSSNHLFGFEPEDLDEVVKSVVLHR